MTRLALLVAALAACRAAAPRPPEADGTVVPDDPAPRVQITVEPRPAVLDLAPPALPASVELPTPSENPHFHIAEAYGVSLYTEVCAWQDLPHVGKELEQYLHAWCAAAAGHRDDGLEQLGDLVGARTPGLDAAVRADLVNLAAMTLTATDAESFLRRHGADDTHALTQLAELYRALGSTENAVALLREVPATSLHDMCVRDARILLAGVSDAHEAEVYTRELDEWTRHDSECRELRKVTRCPLFKGAQATTWDSPYELRAEIADVVDGCQTFFPDSDLGARALADRWPADDAHAQVWFDYAGVQWSALTPHATDLIVTALENALLRAGCDGYQIEPIARRAATLAQRLEPDADPAIRERVDRLAKMSTARCNELRAAHQKR